MDVGLLLRSGGGRTSRSIDGGVNVKECVCCVGGATFFGIVRFGRVLGCLV